jgi:hypothetical protein
MAKRVNVLSDDALQQLRADHERLRLEVQQLQHQVRALSAGDDVGELEIGKTDGSGISALSGTTPGSGTVTLYRKPAGETDLVSTGYTVTCYNMAGAVDASEWVAMIRDRFGRFWVVVEKC